MNDIAALLGGVAGTMLDPITAGLGIIIAFASRRLTVALVIGLVAGWLLGLLSNSISGRTDVANVVFLHILAIGIIILVFYGLKQSVLCLRNGTSNQSSKNKDSSLTIRQDQREMQSEEPYNLVDAYQSWRHKPKETPAHLFDFEFVRNSIDDAVICCNEREGPDFLQGIVCGHMPIAHAVGGNLPYFKALVEYARLTSDDPESRLRVLNTLVMSERATACGLKFLMAQLVLAYGFNTKFPAGESLATNVIRFNGLMDEVNVLLEQFSKYSTPQK